MEKDILLHILTSYLTHSRLFIPTYLGVQVHTYIYVLTGKTLNIPVQESYSKDFLKTVITNSKAVDIPFHLLWLYVAVL